MARFVLKIKCWNCKGSGNCPDCSGRGANAGKECTSCSGSGNCSNCGGSGTIGGS